MSRAGRLGGLPNIAGINTSPPLGRIDVAGSTGDTIPTVRVRGANQTGAVFDLDSTSFPTDATPLFRVYRNGSRQIEVFGNGQVTTGAITTFGTLETSFTVGTHTFYRYQTDNADSCVRIGIDNNGSTGSCFTIANGTSSGVGGTIRMTINARSAGVSRRCATNTLTAGVAAFGTVTLTAGTATVSSEYVAAGDIIRVNLQTPGGTLSVAYGPGTITPGTPAGTFIVRGLTASGAVNTLDTSTVSWEIIRPLTNS